MGSRGNGGRVEGFLSSFTLGQKQRKVVCHQIVSTEKET